MELMTWDSVIAFSIVGGAALWVALKIKETFLPSRAAANLGPNLEDGSGQCATKKAAAAPTCGSCGGCKGGPKR